MKKIVLKYFIAAWTTLNKRAPSSPDRKLIEEDHARYESTEELPSYVTKHRADQKKRVLEQRERARRRSNKELRRLAGLGCRPSHQDVSY